MPRRAKAAITRAAAPSAAKSMKGEVVVSWMTAAETSPMPRAWRAVGRMMRIARQKAEMMNSGLIMPADTAETALPTVKLRMKPAASRMPSRMSERTSSPSQGRGHDAGRFFGGHGSSSLGARGAGRGAGRWRGRGRSGSAPSAEGAFARKRPPVKPEAWHARGWLWRDRAHRRPTGIESRHHQLLREVLTMSCMSVAPFARRCRWRSAGADPFRVGSGL